MHTTPLDPILHQPVRTQIAAYLAGRGKASFTELKKALAVTDGNLEAHLKKMIESEYVEASKDETGGSRQTIYILSKPGLQALSGYLVQLEKLFGQARSITVSEKNASEPLRNKLPKPA